MHNYSNCQEKQQIKGDIFWNKIISIISRDLKWMNSFWVNYSGQSAYSIKRKSIGLNGGFGGGGGGEGKKASNSPFTLNCRAFIAFWHKAALVISYSVMLMCWYVFILLLNFLELSISFYKSFKYNSFSFINVP